MKGIGGCLLAFLGLFGLFFSITISFTYYLLPFAFLFFIGSLIVISYALGPASRQDKTGPLDRQGEAPSKKPKEEP